MSFLMKEQVKYKNIYIYIYIYNISKTNNFDNLTDHFKGSSTAPINCIDYRGPMHIYNEIYQQKKLKKIKNNLNQN